MNFRLLLRDYLNEKLFLCRPTGVVNMRSSILSLPQLVLLTLYLVLILINRMAPLKESIDMWLK
jgi:hypothetical protein